MRTQWNETEHNALRGLSMLAQLLYLRVFRRRMSYQTAIAGGPGNHISTQALVDEVAFIPDPRSNKKAWRPSRGELRAAIAELERPRWLEPDDPGPVVLLVDVGSSREGGYVKKCLLADVGSCAQNMNNQRTTHEQPKEQPNKTTVEQTVAGQEQPGVCVAPIQQPSMSDPPSGIPDNREESSPVSPPCERQRWEPPPWLNRTAWAEFEQHRREMKKPLTDMGRAKAANQLKDLSPEQQQTCIDISIQSRWAGLFPSKVKRDEASSQPRGQGAESAHDRRKRINLELINGAKQHFR